MATRRTTLSADHVTALNMVEIEFYGIQEVEAAYRKTMIHINHSRPLPNDWGDQHKKNLALLISKIANFLGYQLEQIATLDGGYYPDGLVNQELEQQAVRQAIIATLSGNRPLRVSPAAPTPPLPFPPPPEPPEQQT